MVDLQEQLRRAAAEPRSPLPIDRVLERGQRHRRRDRVVRAAAVPVVVGLIVVAAAVLARSDDQSSLEVGPAGEGAPETTAAPGTVTTVRVLPGEPEEGSQPTPQAQTATTTTAPSGAEERFEAESPTTVLVDAVGDTASSDPWAAPGQTRTPEPLLDVVELRLSRTGRNLVVDLGLGDVDRAHPSGADGGAWRITLVHFDGEERSPFSIDIQRYNDYEQVRFLSDSGGSNPCVGCELRFDSEANRIVSSIPVTSLEQALTNMGLRHLRPSSVLESPSVGTQWVHTQRRAADYQNNNRPSGTYAASTADEATGTTAFRLGGTS